MHLKDLETGAHWAVPREPGSAIKALATGSAGPHQQKIALDFILHSLCGVDRMSFLIVDDIPMVMAWREGRRYVGLVLRDIINEPMTDPEPPSLPRARTITESYNRRGPNPD